ncbi:hypothetical protein ABZW11_17315 [Nonomuraea sp. NPDC004580]|uniref:hypothetical protein n=1 Tax=Nonomuraea sp. NPDC004580 TaxID=3154552 RepID=UPI0033A5F6E4
MGRKNKRAAVEEWTALADGAAGDAREAGRRERHHRQRLQSGASTDPQADRYFAREAGEDRKVAEANERDFRAAAKPRRWWQ